MSGVELVLEPVPVSVPAARRFVRGHLGVSSYDGSTVELLVSELVTNALLHARTRMTLRLIELDSCLRVEVVDEGAGTVSRREYVQDDNAESGRGMEIVALLADAYGLDPNANGPGLTAWFEVGNSARIDAEVDVESTA